LAGAAVIIFSFGANRRALGQRLAALDHVVTILISLWTPMLGGFCAGRIFTMGWSAILSGLSLPGGGSGAGARARYGAAGMMTGALVGTMAGAGIAIWQTRDCGCCWGENLTGEACCKVLPLMFGFGVPVHVRVDTRSLPKHFFE
jgi:hypothetical protein